MADGQFQLDPAGPNIKKVFSELFDPQIREYIKTDEFSQFIKDLLSGDEGRLKTEVDEDSKELSRSPRMRPTDKGNENNE